MYNELSLKCLPGQILEKFYEIYVTEYVRCADRRPKPNAESGPIISGLSFPSFRYRSGWYSMGLL